jgi:hypothetical protein
MGIAVTVLLYQLQQQQTRLEQERRVAQIVIDADVDSFPSGEWLASVHLVNSGPSPADFVKLDVELGSLGLSPVRGRPPEIEPQQRGTVTHKELRISSLGDTRHPRCVYTVDIERWQVGEQINVGAWLRLHPDVAARFSDEEASLMDDFRVGNYQTFFSKREGIRSAFVPRVFVYENPNVRAVAQRDKFNELFTRVYSIADPDSVAWLPQCQL